MQDILWLQLNRAYLPPESSMYVRNTDIFQDFTNEKYFHSTMGCVAVTGDLNVRVGTRAVTRIALNSEQETPMPGIVSKRDVPSCNSEYVAIKSGGRITTIFY